MARRPAYTLCRRPGGTLAQVLVLLGILALLVAILLPTIGRVRAASRATTCLSNLRAVAGAFSSYATDNGGQLPYPAFTEVPWERSLSRYAPPDAFECPADEELAPETGSSYDWRDTGVAETTLAGQELTSGRGDAALCYDALPSWHRPKRMNVARVDGSAGSMTTDEFGADLRRPARPP